MFPLYHLLPISHCSTSRESLCVCVCACTHYHLTPCRLYMSLCSILDREAYGLNPLKYMNGSSMHHVHGACVVWHAPHSVPQCSPL